jgi:hypothetical protein
VVALLDELDEGFITLGINMHNISRDTFEYTDKLLNINTIPLANNLLQVPIYILVHPVLVPHDGVVLVELALYYHAQKLPMVRQDVPLVVFQDEFGD